MKIILSRKGFDSSAGGYASPLLTNGNFLCSLPIPETEPGVGIPYARITVNGHNLGPLVSSLTNGSVNEQSRAHLDPDLVASQFQRIQGWKPIFGPLRRAHTELSNLNALDGGNLFLFFGWFAPVEQRNGTFLYLNDPDFPTGMHVIFGWLQIDTVCSVRDAAQNFPWAAYHPHVQYYLRNQAANDVLIIAKARLDLPLPNLNLPGAGLFTTFSDNLRLTDHGRPRSHWRVPRWFRGRLSRVSENMWRDEGDGSLLLRYRGFGQEFVLDCTHVDDALPWLTRIFQCA